MKIEIPEKIRVVMVVTERIGVPTLVCLVFAWVYFTKLQKSIDQIQDLRVEIKVMSEAAKADREEMKREIRRLSFRRER